MGKIIVFMGLSGAGKSHLQKVLTDGGEFDLVSTVSFTTRNPREGEVDGVDYNFIDKKTFLQMVKWGDFVNYDLGSMCGGEIYYGTSKADLENKLLQGNVLMVLSPQGAIDIAEQYPHNVIVCEVWSNTVDRVIKMLERNDMTKKDILERLEVEKDFKILARKIQIHYNYVGIFNSYQDDFVDLAKIRINKALKEVN